MKRTWKNFKLDKNKVYQFIGQAVVYSSLYIAAVAFMIWGFCQNTIYQEVNMDSKTKRNELLITLADINNLIEEIESEQKYNAESAINVRNQLLTAYSIKVQILNNL